MQKKTTKFVVSYLKQSLVKNVYEFYLLKLNLYTAPQATRPISTSATAKMASTTARDEQPLPFLAIAQVLTCVNIFVELYILVALIFYGVRTKRLCAPWNRATTRLLLIGISMPLVHLMNIAVTQFQLVIAYEANRSSLNLTYNTTASSAACKYLNYAGVPTYLLSIFATSLFVWYRQRHIYSLNCIPKLNNIVATYLNNFLFIIVVLHSTYWSIYHKSSMFVIMSRDGCVLVLNFEPNIFNKRDFIIGLILASFWMAGVVGLALYTVIRANQRMSLTGSDLTNRLINKTVKQTLFIVVMSSSSVPTAVYVTNFSFPLNWPVYSRQAVCDLSLVVNSVSILFGYDKPGVNFFGCSQETQPEETQSGANQQTPNHLRRTALSV